MNQTDTGKRYAQKTAFYLVNELKSRFERKGITSDEFWNYIKASHGVSSRKSLTELGWVKLSAKLHTAKFHNHMFTELCEKVKTHKLLKEVADADSEAA